MRHFRYWIALAALLLIALFVGPSASPQIIVGYSVLMLTAVVAPDTPPPRLWRRVEKRFASNLLSSPPAAHHCRLGFT